jgi:predicted house-cleaning noncanonical NTP pyrophosphatase (MazG superfamily)
MKTIEDLYKELVADKKLREELLEAFQNGKVEEFAKAHGCNATMKEIIAFAKTKVADYPILSMFL